MNNLSCYITAAIACVIAAPSANAQQDTNTGLAETLDEVVVTARKRDESLLDVPLAIASFDASSLDRMGAGSLEDLTLFAAGVQFQNQAVAIPGRYNSATRFRGMSTNLSQPSQQIGTVFVDGIWVSGSVFGLGFDDVERVEIIRGPQSALFGRSTFGGAINYVTRTPTPEHKGRVTTEIGDYGTYDVALSHEGALTSDNLLYRISARGFGTDGQYTATSDGGPLGREETKSVAGTLYSTPSDQLQMKLRLSYSEDNDGAPDGFMLGGPLSRRGAGPDIYNCFANGGLDPMTANRDFHCGEVPMVNVDMYTDSNTTLDPGLAGLLVFTNPTAPSESDIPTQNSVGLRRETTRVNFQLDYELNNGMTFSSSTGFNQIEANWIRDSDSTGFSNAWQRDPQVHEDFTQEFRLESASDQKLTWLVGLNYFTSEYLTSGSGGAVAVDPNGETTGILAGPLAFNDAFAEETGDALGLFGAIGYQISDTFSVDLEGRFQKDEVGLNTATESFDNDFSTFLPRLIARYQPNDESTFYGTYSEGNIPGLFNVVLAVRSQNEIDQIQAACGCTVEVEEETLKNLEFGWKQKLLDNRLLLSTSVYAMTWEDQKNLQNVAFIRDDGTPFAQNVIGSVGETDLFGVEIEGRFAATANLDGAFSLNYAKSEYQTYNCAVGFILTGDQNCAGNSSPRYPEWSGSLTATYHKTVGDDWGWFVRPDIIYQGKQYTDETNLAYISSYTVVNLRTGFERDNLRLELYIRNLFDDDSYRSAATRNDFSGADLLANLQNQALFITPAEKRTVGVKAVVEF
ncbi:MAG: TonB-dependent receptor [Gammaproteobacteria bacterium]|nr:TonB-dependent receptor [Gammaproteobacteria bacterium]